MRAQVLTLVCLLVIELSCASPSSRADAGAARQFQINLNLCKEEVGASTGFYFLIYFLN